MIEFPGNCICVALIACALSTSRIRRSRNLAGRWHFYWVDRGGAAYEFYGQGAGQRSYIGNALYFGHVRRMPSRDERLHQAGDTL